MSQLTKQQLKGENQSQFPNNNVGAITPSHLRAFNVDMIDSTVNQTDFTNFSGSVAGEIDALESFSSSLDTNFASQAEFNSYTQSNDSRVTSLINATASYANSASVAAVDSAQQSQIDSLIAATASYVTETESGSFLITASFDNGTRNLTFTKGDTTTFAVNIPDVSGSAGNFVTTSSFNAYTSSNDQRVSSLEAVTSSFATTGSNTFIGNQVVSGYVSASNGFKVGGSANALEIGDGSNIRFLTGSSNFYNIQLVPDVGDIAFSRDGVSNVKTFTLAGTAGANTTFQNNPVLFQSSVSGVTFQTPISVNSGINTNVDITGSLKISSTFDAPLTQGYVWVGASNGRTTTVATSSFGGTTDLSSLNSFTASQYVSNSYFATTGSNNFRGVESIGDVAGTGFGEVYLLARSGSLVLSNSTVTPTYAALAHISSSQINANTNLIFKSNTNTADTIISGSGNIFTNPTAPTAGFKRYLTGGNIAIAGSGVAVPQISGSMAWSPTIANNIFAASATPLTWRGPASASASQINNNVLAGGAINLGTTATFNFQQAAIATTVGGNIIGGAINAIAYKTPLSASININSNIIGGGATLAMDSSSINFSGNSVQGGLTVNNSYFPATTGSQVVTAVNGGLFIGSHTIYASGSNTTFTGPSGRTITNAVILGTNNVISASLNGDLSQVASTALIGQGLVVVGSNSRNLAASAADWGSVFAGRWNDLGGTKSNTAETIFAVGTGTATGTRKTGFLIDSGSNTFVEGTLNVSGSTILSSSLYIQSGSTLPASTGSSILTWNAATGQVSQASFSSIVSASVSSGQFWSTTTQSGSAGVSGSIQFNNSGSFYNVSLVNGTQLTVVNGGVYNIQFSAQIETSAGADTMYIWFKKNGTNIGDSASKAVLANNTAQIMTVNILDQAVANDYYEIVYQNLNGHATVLAEAASGNIPAIPSVITTITQIR